MITFTSILAIGFVACNGSRNHAFAASTGAPPATQDEKSYAINPAPPPSSDSKSSSPAVTSASGSSGEHKWSFDDDAVGAPPTGFSFGRTGSGRLGRWTVQEDPSSSSGKNVLAQLDTDDTDYRFPIAAANEPALRDGSLSVRCKPVSGGVDQACGLVFRYRDPDNYYVARANALENNVRLYHVKNGSRQQFAGWNGKVSTGHWHVLRIEARGDHIEVYWEEKKVIDAHDSTFPDAGKVGVWTKADSVTYFDDLHMRAIQ